MDKTNEKTTENMILEITIEPKKWSATYKASGSNKTIATFAGSNKMITNYFICESEVDVGDILELFWEINQCLDARGVPFRIGKNSKLEMEKSAGVGSSN